jgi:hypothetical protein
MSRDDDPQVFAYEPTGWKVETGDPREAVYSVGGLTRADEHRLKVARQSFVEARAEDFEQQGKDWVDRATGERYHLVHFDPTLSDHPPDTGVTRFIHTSDDHLVYLRPVNTDSRGKTVVMGAVGELRAR